MNAAYRRRRRPFRSLLFILGGACVLSVALFIVAQSALDPEKLRILLQDAVLRATGRVLTISGGVHLRLGLSPELEADDVALANIDGGSRPQMLTAKSMRADLALLPLLGGDAVISALSIDQPDLLLERTADGRANWIFTPAHRAALYQDHGGGGARHRMEIRAITVSGGQVQWAPREGAPRVVTIGRLSLSAADSDSPMFVSLDGFFDGAGGAVPFTLSGNSGSMQRLQGGGISALAGTWPLTLKLSLQGADLKLDGGINHPERMRSFELRLTGHADDLSIFNPLLPKPFLPPLAHVNFTALLSDNGDGVMRTSQVSIRAEDSDLSRLVPGLTVKQAILSAPGPGQLGQLSVDGSYADQPLRFAATAMQPDFMAATAPVQLTLSAQAAGASLTAHGTLPPSTETGGLDLQIEAHAPDLATLSPLVGRKLPPARDLGLSAELQDAGVKLRGVTVHNLVVSSSLGDMNGDLTLDWRPRPAVSGTLTSRSLDLDALASGMPGSALPSIWPPPQNSTPPIQVTPAEAAPPPAQAGPEAMAALPLTLPLDFLRNHDATLTLNIGDLTAWGAHYRDVAAHLELQDGKLALNPFRAQADDGALIAGASIDATTDQPPIAINLRSPSVAARAVTSLLGTPGEASGVMQVDAVLSGIGPTLSSFEVGMNGRVGLAMVNGDVDNAVLQGLLGDILQTEGVTTFGDGTTGVRCFAVRLDFTDGVGRLRTLSADTSRLSLSGSGTINLRDQSADLHLRPQLKVGPAQVSAPVTLQGNFGALKASLDPAFAGGRVGFEIGGASSQSGCVDALALARNGLGGPLPQAAPPAPDQGLPLRIKKPKDLLQGLFH